MTFPSYHWNPWLPAPMALYIAHATCTKDLREVLELTSCCLVSFFPLLLLLLPWPNAPLLPLFSLLSLFSLSLLLCLCCNSIQMAALAFLYPDAIFFVKALCGRVANPLTPFLYFPCLLSSLWCRAALKTPKILKPCRSMLRRHCFMF